MYNKDFQKQPPQQFVFSTLKELMFQLNTLIRDLNIEQDELEKKIEETEEIFTDHIKDNDRLKVDLIKEINELKAKIETLMLKIADVEVFINTTKIQISTSEKLLNFLAKAPVKIVAFCTALTSIIIYLSKFINP